MNKGIFILAVTTFVAGTVELVIAGILGMIAEDLHVSVGTVGQLVSIFLLFCVWSTYTYCFNFTN